MLSEDLVQDHGRWNEDYEAWLEDRLEADLAEPWDYEEPIQEVPDWEYEKFIEEVQTKYHVRPSNFVETSIRMPNPDTRQLEAFSFAERRYLRRVYDSPSKRVLLMCGRQVEKTVLETEPLLRADGSFLAIKDIQVGDEVACLETYETPNPDGTIGAEAATGSLMACAPVTWKSQRYKKPCVRISTRQGHATSIALTHPVRTWNGYTEAGELQVGDKIAVTRRAGVFYDEPQHDSRVALTGFMIGDGYCDPKGMSFTSNNFDVLQAFDEALAAAGMDYTFSDKKGSSAVALRLPQYKAQQLHDWLVEDGLMGCDSYTKFIPDWVFRLSREQTALFINRLWATDGHVKKNTASKWSIEYCSMSERLCLQIQSLLRKFGIPSKIRKNWPSIYKRRGVEKYAYILRVETQTGVLSFVREIGAVGKIDRHDLAPWEESNNRDTYPAAVTRLVREIYEEVSPTKGDRTLRSCGIDRLPREEYLLTPAKLATFVEFFEGDTRYDEAKVALLRDHLSSDIYWDEITGIESLGEQWCYDISVKDHHNFVCGSIITHNSTTLCMRMLAMTCLIPHFRCLFVSPSMQQTKDFSSKRLKEVIETCPDIRMWYPPHLTDNVFEKAAINRSAITLRAAFLNADRTRGNSADLVAIDEIQDQILDNIPIIEETASHSKFKFFLYSGTPKSLDNPIEHFWQNFSTQNEWAVPCERHGTPKDPGSWHWNILGEKNIGKKGLICDKPGCGGPISAAHPMAQWVQTSFPDTSLSFYEGFRIPQLMVPWAEWKDLLTKYESYGQAEFYNECLGRSFDSGQRPLTQQDVVDNCDPQMRLSAASVKKWRQTMTGVRLYAGIDWGQDSTNSYTVIFVGGYWRNRFRILFTHRFDKGHERDKDVQLKTIMRIIDTFRIERVGVDYGGGADRNDALQKKYGSHRIVKLQYTSPNVYMRWDARLGRYIVNKHEVMAKIFTAIKRRDVFTFPNWDDFKTPFAKDMLSIFSEYSERLHMTQYKKSPNNTDDSFHALLYSFCVSMLDVPRPDIFVPSAKIDRLLADQ